MGTIGMILDLPDIVNLPPIVLISTPEERSQVPLYALWLSSKWMASG